MITERFLLGRRRSWLDARDLAALENAISDQRQYPRRVDVICKGDPLDHSMLLVDGFMCRYMDDRRGYRQLVAIHIPGDFVDLHGYPLKWLDHDLATLSDVTLARVPHDAITRLEADHPRLGRMLWFATTVDAAVHREWIFRMGRLDALARVAHFFCELELRMRCVGLAADGSYALPVIQNDIAEACGTTPVHINRVLRQLRERRLVTFRSGRVTIHDLAALQRLAEFDGSYLYADDLADFGADAARR